MNIVDAAQREEALQIQRSFRVTAPAGSGKTELLIQRYLALLPSVQRPEQVLAITFTRKAAAEMLERVVAALGEAVADAPVNSPHQRRTRDLASAAVAHGRKQGWELPRDVARFNIRTIDGFCASLAQHMPVLSGFGGRTGAEDDATMLYREAVAELFSLVGSSRPESADLDALLLHFDNNWDRLAGLLTGMLGKREQWLEYVEAGRQSAGAEAQLRLLVEALVREELLEIRSGLAPWLDELYPLFRFSAANLGLEVPETVPATDASHLACWRAIAKLLLKTDGAFRQRLDRRNGFPADSKEAKAIKAAATELLGRMREDAPQLAALVQRLDWLPVMDESLESWQLVLHLSHVLPLLSACLLLVFSRRGAVDHTQVAVSALDALGDDDAPTELALRLDYRIEHILVDEFQDTSNLQYRLLERLTRGWAEHNAQHPEHPRTLFIVGDGMQSIYGFRNANVGLFQKVAEQGFNGVIPEPLALQCNFRSARGVVDWINETFSGVFPADGDLRRGTVAFTPATAVREAGQQPAVEMHAFHGEQAAEQEARCLAELIHGALEADPASSIAVLGRTRNHLAPLVGELRRRGIPFAAQEMGALARSPAVIDLMTLSRALANPGDRVAWFALLRAPWCGLQLADLTCLSEADNDADNPSLVAMLLAGEFPAEMSAPGRTRLLRVSRCLQWAWEKRDRLSLRIWLEQLWQMLGGPACLSQERHLGDAAEFLALLERAEMEGRGLDILWLEERVQKLYAAGEAPEARLQVMTLHKAKGLEFDWVFMPALSRRQRGDARDILLWDEFNAADGSSGFLLAADDHSAKGTPGLYNYLSQVRKDKARNETARLLYVGTTRAAGKLVLSAVLKPEDPDAAEPVAFKSPGEGSLLAPLWPQFERDMVVHPVASLDTDVAAADLSLRILENAPAAPAIKRLTGENLPQPVTNRLERHVGTVTHMLLEQLALTSPLPAEVPEGLLSLARHQLAQAGLHGEFLERGHALVSESVARTVADTRWGRWLLDARHRDAQCELALSWPGGEGVRDIVIDRTFIDRSSGERWLVDYKSSVPGPEVPLESFLAEEAARYRPQLEAYRDCLSLLGDEPLRCALYFTRLALLHRMPELDTGEGE